MDGLGLLPGAVRKFSSNILDDRGAKFKVPHMGWNTVDIRQAHPIFEGIDSDEYFYFVHSYFVENNFTEIVAGTTDYAFKFAAALTTKNLFAVQFHPEKSHSSGLQLLENFVTWKGI